ncbi:MAG: hypothetical protein PHH54_04970 [Candidatus Nanoarchaeia archaeon]|nr:hypothetical protein [Candidatus Nanoarchaeia archaeon]MDD5741310.1 hypothetical protein [Candidatus Nanoarchaeia archaeon]
MNTKNILLFGIFGLLTVMLISLVSACDTGCGFNFDDFGFNFDDFECDFCNFEFNCSSFGFNCFEPICSSNSDCGDSGLILSPYCYNNDVYQMYKTFECKNPGELDSYCHMDINSVLKKECEYGCFNGECVDEPEPECGDGNLDAGEECDDENLVNGDGCNEFCIIESEGCCSDTQCPIDTYSDKYCISNNIYHDFINHFCEDGNCLLNITPQLFENCGSNSYGAWDNYCIGKEVWKNKTDVLRGCSGASCFTTPDYKNEFVENCTYGCEDGNCAPEPEHHCGDSFVNQAGEECDDGNNVNGDGCSSECKIEIIPCCSDEQCPNDSYSDKYCYNSDVYWNLNDWSCGGNETCVINVIQKLFQDCGNESYSDNYCYNGDVYKDHIIPGCANGACSSSNVKELVKECDNGCEDGVCASEEEDDKENKHRCCYDEECSEYYYTHDRCKEFDDSSSTHQSILLGLDSELNSQNQGWAISLNSTSEKSDVLGDSKSPGYTNKFLLGFLIIIIILILILIVFLIMR